ncbi:MAG TPA: ImmA/IrrE family metallo-endopeptidase [Chloroflexi bacterium]|nr:ImmA/IrrE family metallo-endopeptidase [Chloroflexota bacterium]
MFGQIPLHNELKARERVIQLVNKTKQDAGISGGAYYRGPGDLVARCLNITVIESQLNADEGLYLNSDPPTILLDTHGFDRDRVNFTFFHEITHHLIKQDDDLIAFVHEFAFEDSEKLVEALCNIGAAEFLVPSREIRSAIDSEGFRIELLINFDKIYPASKPAIAIQLAQCAPHQCIVVVCEFGQLPGHRQTQSLPMWAGDEKQPEQLFTQLASSSPSVRYAPGRFVKIRSDHLLWQVFQEKKAMSGTAQIPFHSGKKWETRCDAIYYLGKVYAAFHIDTPPSPLQQNFGF